MYILHIFRCFTVVDGYYGVDTGIVNDLEFRLCAIIGG